jgi:hypothetical protein
MTTPTQAQIEAAAKAVQKEMEAIGARNLSLGDYEEHEIAKAALTAALALKEK